jgi:hypothetical protein
MTSERKIAANQRNGRKSRGPRTAAGKFQVSRNALRHGLAALTHRQLMPSADMKRLTDAICGDDDAPLLREQARIVAETELMLRAIQAQKLAVIERLRETGSIALARGDNSFELAKARIRQTDLAEQRASELCANVREQYKEKLSNLKRFDDIQPDGLVPVSIIMLEECSEAWEAMDGARKNPQYLDQASKLVQERDEPEAVQEALPDLVRLDRYEQRAWSRQKRAIRNLMKLRQDTGSNDEGSSTTQK